MIKYKKLSVTALVAVLAMVGVIGCGTGAASNSTSDGNTSVESTVSLTSLTSNNGTIEFDDEDLVSSYNASDCKKIDLSSGAVTITEAGTYIVSGTLTNGSLKVNYSGKETVRLIFNGVNITNSSEAPVIVEDGKKVIITLADGSTNTITDNRSTDLDDDYTGAISSKADLIFNGSGALNITANHKNGIKSNDDLKIVSGTFNINSAEDGIIGKDCLCIKNGTFTVTAGDDGMKSTYDKDDTKGYIVIENGTFNITAGNDGIQSEHSLTIYDGTFTIKTGTGATESIQTSSNMNVNPGNRFGGDFKNGSLTTTTTEDTESIKGIKAGGAIAIVSGTFNIDSEDDALHSNDTILISGGTYKLASGDDGIHADSTVQIDNGTIVISTSYEGIEGAVINITGGDISVTSSDDGLNASDGSTTEGGGMFFNRGGGKTSTGSSSTSSVALNISGGKLYVNASGDGLDSNGSLNISGGEIVVDGPTSSNDTALDYETSMTFTGGTVMAFGSNGMVENPTSASNGCAIVSTFTSQSAGSSFSLTDASGNVILSATPSKAYSALIVYSPNIKSDTTYTITAGTYSSSVTTSSSIVTDGSSGGFGGFGGVGKSDDGSGKGGMNGQSSDGQTQDGTLQMPDNMQMPDGQSMDGQIPDGTMQMPDGQSMDGNMQMPDGQNMDGNMQMPDGQSIDGNMQMPNQNQQGDGQMGGNMNGNGGSF